MSLSSVVAPSVLQLSFLKVDQQGVSLFFSQCSIDLKKNVLLIGTTGTETRFLSEAELPECARLAYGAEGREDVRPDELADRELAEALQRSIQESGKRPSARLRRALFPT